jgi:hypothetical protein
MLLPLKADRGVDLAIILDKLPKEHQVVAQRPYRNGSTVLSISFLFYERNPRCLPVYANPLCLCMDTFHRANRSTNKMNADDISGVESVSRPG